MGLEGFPPLSFLISFAFLFFFIFLPSPSLSRRSRANNYNLPKAWGNCSPRPISGDPRWETPDFRRCAWALHFRAREVTGRYAGKERTRGQKFQKARALFQHKLVALPPTTPILGPQKKKRFLLGKNTRRDTHTNFFRGILGSQRAPNGPFWATKSLLLFLPLRMREL